DLPRAGPALRGRRSAADRVRVRSGGHRRRHRGGSLGTGTFHGDDRLGTRKGAGDDGMRAAKHLYPVDRVTLREVGLRDGLQLVKTWPDTAAKRAWLYREHAAGVRHFEVGSFLPVSRFPQFADLDNLIDTVARLDGASSAALALNERGAEEAMGTAVDEVVCVVSATEEHSQAN